MTEFVTRTIDGREYTNIVPKDYIMDPVTEDLYYGDELDDGMVVLVEQGYRNDEDFPTLYRRLLMTNRWCTVTKARQAMDGMGGEEVVKTVHFVGLYSDGTKEFRSYPPGVGWLVKIPETTKGE